MIQGLCGLQNIFKVCLGSFVRHYLKKKAINKQINQSIRAGVLAQCRASSQHAQDQSGFKAPYHKLINYKNQVGNMVVHLALVIQT